CSITRRATANNKSTCSRNERPSWGCKLSNPMPLDLVRSRRFLESVMQVVYLVGSSVVTLFVVSGVPWCSGANCSLIVHCPKFRPDTAAPDISSRKVFAALVRIVTWNEFLPNTVARASSDSILIVIMSTALSIDLPRIEPVGRLVLQILWL